MVDLLFIAILDSEIECEWKSQYKRRTTYPRIGFRYTLGNHLLVALLVTGVSAVLALITEGIEQELAAEGAENELVELLLNEFMSVHLVHLVLAFSNGTLTAKRFHRAFADILLD